MKVLSSEKKNQDKQVEVKVEISAEEFNAAVNKAYVKMRGRINVPGTVSQNWEWRLEPNAFSRTKASHMAELVRRYGR